ncbi:MAG: hypothetical protein GX864_00945 [Mollicutes bacterium]|nr:hypothetical protein [Mollicutes bacterium]
MTNIRYQNQADKLLIDKSFYYNTWLVFGKKDPNVIKSFLELFNSEVKEINVFPQGTVTEHLSPLIIGICRKDDSSGKLIVEMLGFENAVPSQKTLITHGGVHEFCHAFANLLPTAFSKYPDGIIEDGVKYKNEMGLISETDAITGKPVGQHFYGKMFNETMMDIITSIGVLSFEPQFSNNPNPAHQVLNSNYKSWGNATTGYSIFTSITRLAIAAFSNNGFINYDQIIKNGGGIFDVVTLMKDGSKKKANDFMYGILFDPLHIEKEFDKYMGKGYYRTFCKYLDRAFILFSKNQQIPSEEKKRIMNILPDFLNKKCSYYRQHGLLDDQGVDAIIGNFNKIWNSMQAEYSAYFTQQDIVEIEKRSRTPM